MSLDKEGAQNLNKSEELTCEERIEDAINSRGEDFLNFFDGINKGCEETIEEYYNYGLSVDMVSMGTFRGQKEPYLRYQLSFGGPSEEINFYQNGRVEFVFKDWFDYAVRKISHLDWVDWLRDNMVECELLTNEAFFKAWEVE